MVEAGSSLSRQRERFNSLRRLLVDGHQYGSGPWNVFLLSNADIRFAEQLVCWSYTTQRSCFLTTTRRVGFVDKREYTVATLGGPK